MPPLINTFGVASARSFGFANLRNASTGGWIRGETSYTGTIGYGIKVTSDGIFGCERGPTTTGTLNGAIKLTTSGAIVWNNCFTYSSGNGRSTDIELDSSGNIYLLANSTTGTGVVKADSSGSFVYYRQLSSAYNSITSNLWVSGSNVYIGAQTTNATSTASSVVASVNQAGSAINWSRTIGPNGSSSCQIRSVAADSSGNVYSGFVSFGTNGFVKLNSSGTLQWSRSGTTPTCIAFDSSGNIYTGNFFSQIVAFDPSGTLLWSGINRLPGITMESYDIALDSAGNVYAAGNSRDTIQGLIIKYNSSGAFQWLKSITVNSLKTAIFGISIDNVNSRMCITGGSISSSSCPYFIASLPTDGTGTGTYSVGGYTYTYASETSGTGTSPTITSQSTSTTVLSPTYTDTGNVTGMGSNTIATSLTSF